jgi:hypothetical protein
MVEKKRSNEAVREVINAAEEPRPVLFAWDMGICSGLKRGRERKWAYVGEEVWE